MTEFERDQRIRGFLDSLGPSAVVFMNAMVEDMVVNLDVSPKEARMTCRSVLQLVHDLLKVVAGQLLEPVKGADEHVN
jgi:hypothetical protein